MIDFARLVVRLLPALALSPMVTAMPQQAACNCTLNPNSPCCIGRWVGPYNLGISCTDGSGCGTCSDPFGFAPDEIGHAALIPVGPHAGKVLIWTRCDNLEDPTRTADYTSWLWDPVFPDQMPTALEIKSALNPSGPPYPNGPFCSGHVWMLDELGKAKLFTVGGTDFGLPCHWIDKPPIEVPPVCGQEDDIYYCGHSKVYWFDPDPLAPALPRWDDTPRDLPYRNWYPTAIQYLQRLGPGKFSPIVLGGSAVQSQGCGTSSVPPCTPPGTLSVPFQYAAWWTLPFPYTGPWATWSDTYMWHWYPRAFLLEGGSEDSAGTIAVAGHDIVCERPYSQAAHQYGDNPSQRVTPPFGGGGSDWSAGLDPNVVEAVGGWGSANAVILHTLVNKTAWPSPLSSWRTNYDLNRVIATGGLFETIEDNLNTNIDALPDTLELQNAPNGPWVAKALPPSFANPRAGYQQTPRGRVFGNFVPLPDGTILYCGGQNVSGGSALPLVYFRETDCFDPQGPQGAGSWQSMHSRTVMGNHPVVGGDYGTPRGYHSVALLLEDGTVALMGGQPHFEQDPSHPLTQVVTEDSVEIFQPPYHFYTNRLQNTAALPLPDMEYGVPYCASVNSPNKVAYACLMGVGSTTHHFDYGQRYIELMVNHVSCSGGNIQVLPPPSPTMAPEGYYLLFFVEYRSQGGQTVRVPSKGEFVKLKFPTGM